MKTIQVLYISYDGMTDPLGQSQVIPYLEKLSECGYCFTILSFEKKEIYHKRKQAILKILSAHQIEWVPMIYHKSPPVLSTVYDVFKMRKKALELHRDKKFSILHCRSYLSALVGLYFQKTGKARFVFDMRGFWADERVDGKIWSLKNPVLSSVYHFFKRKEKEFFNSADAVISLTENAKRVINSWEGIELKNEIKVIPCCADLEKFHYETTTEKKKSLLLQKLGMTKSDFILLYLGSAGTWYKTREMLHFFKVLKTHQSAAKFLILTADTPESFARYYTEFSLDPKDITITFANREEVPDYISLASLAIFFILPTFSKKASSPTKQGEIMGMGVPIICNDFVGDTGEIIKKTQSGYVLSEFNEKAYNHACTSIPQLLETPRSRIRQGALHYYSLTEGANRYREVYEDILK